MTTYKTDWPLLWERQGNAWTAGSYRITEQHDTVFGWTYRLRLHNGALLARYRSLEAGQKGADSRNGKENQSVSYCERYNQPW
jgi:hypothetical protein